MRKEQGGNMGGKGDGGHGGWGGVVVRGGQEGGYVPRKAGNQGEKEKAESLDPANCKCLSGPRATLPHPSPLLIYAGSQSPGMKRNTQG